MCDWPVGLRLQHIPLGQHTLQKRLHAKFSGYGDAFVLSLGGLFAVASTVAFQQNFGIVPKSRRAT